MNFEALEINIQPELGQWWITILNFETANEYGGRSLLHIERNNGVWKIQALWLNNNCWIF